MERDGSVGPGPVVRRAALLVAAETGRSRTTVKWHIRHIYAKHNLSRQMELAQLVTSVTDVPGVRD